MSRHLIFGFAILLASVVIGDVLAIVFGFGYVLGILTGGIGQP